MAAREISSIEELRSLVGTEVGVGDWHEVTQAQVDLFAEATGDHQWIHVDRARAEAESPFGTTIAHGFLTLSLLSMFVSRTVRLTMPIRMGINYGLNRVRFVSPVPVGSRIRPRMILQSLEELPDGQQLVWAVTIEREGGEKPCCVAEWLVRHYFEGQP
jgi:acyl dehydratase